MLGSNDGHYQIHVHHGWESVSVLDDNIDLEVRFEDGSRHAATFFTLANLLTLFAKNKRTGECADGLYLWASDMILVKELTEATVARTVEALIAAGEFDSAFTKLGCAM